MKHRSAPLLFLVPLLLTGACTAPRTPREVTSTELTAKIPAIKSAVRSEDQSVVRHLIDDLESDDPAVRFYAIKGLRHLTGQTFGYDYFAAEPQRAVAVERWRHWLAETQASSE